MKTLFLLAVLLDGFEVTEQVNPGQYDANTCEIVREQEMAKPNNPYGYICYEKPFWDNKEHINPNDLTGSERKG